MTTTNAIDSLNDYRDHGYPLGGFLTAVLSHDLMGAVGHADPTSLASLGEIARYVHWELPAQCHGSAQRVKAWLAKFPA